MSTLSIHTINILKYTFIIRILEIVYGNVTVISNIHIKRRKSIEVVCLKDYVFLFLDADR